MHRFRSWTFDPPEFRSQRNRLLPIEGGDGSTLSLDFTTGVLDPRLTFTRGSNATFINSSGIVQWADANLMRNSNWSDANAVPTSWTGVGNAPTIPSTGSRTFTVTTAALSYMVDGGPNATGIQGLQYTASLNVTAVSGSPNYSNTILATSFASGEKWYRNGSLVNGTDVVQPGLITYVFTSGNGSLLRIGVGASGVNQTNQSVTLTQPRLMPGNRLDSPYFASSTTAAYYGPRFDHDPTTLLPKGLLIEGTATNLGSYSEDFSNAAWTKSGTNGSMVLTGTAPDNNATSRLLEENTTSYAKHSLERSISISAGIHTLSVWLKESSTNSRRYAHIQLADGQATAARYTIVADLQTGTITASGANNGTAGAPTGTGHSITAYPNGWYRVTISMNHVASPSYPVIMLGDSASLFGGNNQPFYSATTPYKGLLIWGAQLETGSGASSYIPTGASTVQRLFDSCSIPVSAFGFVTTGGTFQVNYRRGEFGTQNRGILNTDYVGGRWLGCSSTNASSTALLEWWNGSFGIATQVTGPNKYAYSYGANTGLGVTSQLPVSLSVNGSTTKSTFGNGTTTGNDVPNLANITNVVIGAASQTNPYSTATRDFLNNCVSLVKYWPIRLSDAQLTTLTT